jgi:cytochrome c556
MDAIDEQVAPLDRATAGQKADLKDLKERAYLINVLMAAFPHLFPDGTRPAEISADGTQTSATEDVWSQPETFYGLSQTAATAAYEASQATDLADLRIHAVELRQACDACHMSFMAGQAPPPTK